MLGAVVGTIVDKEPHWTAAADERALEHGEEGGGVLRVREGGEGNRPGGIVDECNEVGLSPSAPVAHGGAVHDIALPALAGVAEGEPAPVGGDGVIGVFVEESFAREQPVHGRGREGVVDAALAGGLDEGVDRQRGVLGLERDELLGDLWRQAPGLAAVGACLRVQGVEAA